MKHPLILFPLCLTSISLAQSLAWPPGYFNARTATDPSKPQPQSMAKELKLTATHHSIGVEWNIAGDTDHDPLRMRRDRDRVIGAGLFDGFG